LYDNEKAKAENFELKNGKFFNLKESANGVMMIIRTSKEDTVGFQIHLNYAQAYILQKHFFSIPKRYREKDLHSQVPELVKRNAL
jgi:hypothetical protein